MGFRVPGLGVLGFRGLGFWSSGLRVGFRVQGVGVGFGGLGLGEGPGTPGSSY